MKYLSDEQIKNVFHLTTGFTQNNICFNYNMKLTRRETNTV